MNNVEPKNLGIAEQAVIVDLTIGNSGFDTSSVIASEIEIASVELDVIDETIAAVDECCPHCDKIDYAIASGSGMICSLIDIFLVGVPGQDSVLGNISDKWIDDCVERFAKLNGWSPEKYKSSAISFLERLYKVPYDQRGCGDAGMEIFELDPSNHHFKSLGHQPSLIGLVFSIIDQFTNQSHFVTNDQLIALEEANDKFILHGSTFLGKLFCGFVNWFGHLVSDVAGSNCSTTRGMGIPSPIWSWVNSLIVLKSKLGLPDTEFNRRLCEIAVEVYKAGVDFRFAVAQSVPVIMNELIVRLFYSIRKYVNIYKAGKMHLYTWKEIWNICKPFKNPTLIRMLTVAHGTFCALDLGDATIRAFIKGGGYFNPVEFFVRLNVVGFGRLTIALYGEAKMSIRIKEAKHRAMFARKERYVIEDYIRGLNELSCYYNDRNFSNVVEALTQSKDAKSVFEQSIQIAKSRNVENPLLTKTDIDNYFFS